MKALNYDQIYDLETPLELAVQAYLRETTALAVFTRLDSLKFSSDEDTPDFQKVRPRIELFCVVNGPMPPAHFWLMDRGNDEDGNPRQEQHIDAFRVSIGIQLTTDFDGLALASGIHPNNRARIRLAMARMQSVDNEDLMPYHLLARCWPAESGQSIRDRENGLEISTLTYSCDYFIRSDAWFEP